MKKLQILTLLLIYSISNSQIKITPNLAREINEQIFDSDNKYPKTIIQSNKRFELIKGLIKEEILMFPDNIRIVNTYNKKGNLINTKSFKKNELKSDFFYEYENDGKTLKKERGVNNLNYYSVDKFNFFAIKSESGDTGINYKFLDTLFIKEQKHQYEFTKKSKQDGVPLKNYKFQYNDIGYLKSIIIFKNNLRTGHLINYYNNKKQLQKQEFFWDYKWFYFDTGSQLVRNNIYEFKYGENGIIKSIKQKNYNPIIHEWEETITNYNSVISLNDSILNVNLYANSGLEIIIKIDDFGNWIYKSERLENTIQVTKRILKYFSE